VLDINNLIWIPALQKGRKYATMTNDVTVEVRSAFKRTDSLEMRRLHRGRRPLVHRIVGHPSEADIAIAPQLVRSPFNTIV